MKNLFGFLFVCLLVTMTSCGDDDCTADDFVGVYNGTISCTGEDEANGVLTITKVSETSISATDMDGTEFVLNVEECIASATIDFFGIMVTQTLTLDGDNIDYRATSSGIGQEVICTGSLTRQ